MSEESISIIIKLKDQQLTEKYFELSRATSQQQTMKVFFWGGIAFMFVGMFLKNQMSTFVELIWGVIGFASMIYGVANMPKDDMLQRMKDKIAILELEIKQLKETEK